MINKKNNQSSVSDADRKILTLRSMDNAGNSVNLVSGIICYPLIVTSRSASEFIDRVYLSLHCFCYMRNWVDARTVFNFH